MSKSEDVWQKRASALQNPEALDQKEKDWWVEIEPILVELLEELKSRGKIEISFVPTEIEHMGSILGNLAQIGTNNSLLFDSIRTIGKFVKANSEFGFDEVKIAHLLVESCVLRCIMDTELFKVLLLFHLKGVSHKAANYNSTFTQFAPTAWKKLKPYVDNKFRNSLAHGTWAIEGEQVVLFEDAKVIPYEKLNFDEFIIRVKKQNLLFSCLYNLLIQKNKDKFFR